MPVHKIDVPIFVSATSFTLGVWPSADRQLTVTATQARATLSGAARNNPVSICAAATTLLQAQLDTVIPLASLPSDDPDKTVNPNRPDLFWSGTNLIGRAITVLIRWDATIGRPVLQLTRTN